MCEHLHITTKQKHEIGLFQGITSPLSQDWCPFRRIQLITK